MNKKIIGKEPKTPLNNEKKTNNVGRLESPNYVLGQVVITDDVWSCIISIV